MAPGKESLLLLGAVEDHPATLGRLDRIEVETWIPFRLG
jgi:hypothetical protein